MDRPTSPPTQAGEVPNVNLAQVAESLAHQFNNLLMGIQTFASVIEKRVPDDPAVVNAVHEINTAVGRGKDTSQQILRFAQPIEPELRRINLSKMLMDQLEDFRKIAGKDIWLDVQIPEAAVEILADRDLLFQALSNIVTNSREASPSSGTVLVMLEAPAAESSDIQLSPPQAWARLVVVDTGPGIASENLSRVGEALFTTRKGHLGLGLAVVKRIMAQHGGSMRIRPAATGGTEVSLYFPRSMDAGHEEVHQGTRSVQTLVLVEDESIVSSGISAVLEGEGIEVHVVELGNEALTAIEQHLPDAVVLDIGLPDIDGVEVYRRIASRWPRLPVVFSTGHGDETRLAGYLLKPNVGFLSKPYDLETLLSTLQRVVAHS